MSIEKQRIPLANSERTAGGPEDTPSLAATSPETFTAELPDQGAGGQEGLRGKDVGTGSHGMGNSTERGNITGPTAGGG